MISNIDLIIERTNKLKKAGVCFGITSKCGDNKHIVFCDFDNINISEVFETLKNMQFHYELSTFYIVKSTNGYNAFCLSKMDLKDITSMLKEYHSIDPLFIKLSSEKRKLFVLRMDKDKHFCAKLPSYDTTKQLSNAHYRFFTEIMDFPLEPINKRLSDNLKFFRIIAYKSTKHGWCKSIKFNNLKEFKSEYGYGR